MRHRAKLRLPRLDPSSLGLALLAVLLVVGGGTAASVEGCPKSCFCNALSKIVYCSRRGLVFVPDSLPEGTLQLNLNGNALRSRSLQRTNFSRHASLEHLYLSDCGIEAIEVDTFVDLINLKWLDMSDNRLRVIQDSAFRGLRLQHLFLNGNEGIRLLATSFHGLATTGLYLHDCGLTALPPEVIASLNGTLGNLWLNGNQLERIDAQLQTIFASLSHVRLASNPLRCNCEVVWLKELYDRNGDVFRGAEPPVCHSPTRLRGRHFGELSIFDFRCQSPAFSNIDALFGSTQGLLKCVATGDPAPSLYWIQPSGKAIKYDPPQTEELNRNEGVLLLDGTGTGSSTGTSSGLSGMYICIANNEAGNVTLTINVSWPHVRTTSSHPDHLFRHHPHHNHILPHLHLTPPSEGGDPAIHANPLTIPYHQGPSLRPPSSPTEGYVLLRATPPPMSGPAAAERQPMFTLTELALSVVGTHFATILLTVGCLSIYHWTRRRKADKIQRQLYADIRPATGGAAAASGGGRVAGTVEECHVGGGGRLCREQDADGGGTASSSSAFRDKSLTGCNGATPEPHFSTTQFHLMKR